MDQTTLKELIDKFNTQKIDGLTVKEQIAVFNALKDLEMYQGIGTIEQFAVCKHDVTKIVSDNSKSLTD